MGCDGGTIPKRDELVKTKKKKEQKDKSSELAFRWQHCAITQQPLQQPIVACELGRIYSKEAVIETLLDKPTVEPTPSASAPKAIASHIKSLSNVKALNLTENPAWSESSTIEKGDAYIDVLKSRWICPISGQEMNGRFRFIVLWVCGCVLSERALKMSKNKESGDGECPRCQAKFKVSDVVVLNPGEEELPLLEEKMEARRAEAKAAKDLKKAKKRPKTETVTSEAVPIPNADVALPSTSTSTKNGGVKLPQKHELPLDSKLSKKMEPKPPKMTKINGKYSVAKDPNVSDTYKSLFTTSDKAKEQQKAHWVTYNPFYN